MPQVPMIFVEIFDIWRIDFIGSFLALFGFTYILLVVDYIFKCMKVRTTQTNNLKVV